VGDAQRVDAMGSWQQAGGRPQSAGNEPWAAGRKTRTPNLKSQIPPIPNPSVNDSIVLLPADSLEELALDQESAAAETLLVAWTAPFHPAIVAATGRTVRWQSAGEFVDEEIGPALVLLPSVSEGWVPNDWIERAEAAGAVVLRDLADRDAAVNTVLERLEPPPGHLPPNRLNADLVADLYALGFCQLLVELLTRQHYYVGSVDKERFDERTVRAAEAILRGDNEAAKEDIQSAFDLLTEGREYFYAHETHLIDLILVAASTSGQSLREELAGKTPKALLISGRSVAAIAAREPATLNALRAALDEKNADLLGGEYGEPALALATPEAILAGIRRGLAAYEAHLGRRPSVFARRRFGLTPLLPQILQQCGFTAACHFTLDGGQFPTGNQSKIRWEGAGDATIEAIARVPIDAAGAEAFLRLPERLSGTMDLDDVPTVVFAHWPLRASRWLDALRRIGRYGPAIGRFVGVGDYFAETVEAGQVARYLPDEYRSPCLDEAVAAGQRDAISRWVRYHGRQATVDAIGTLRCMAAAIRGVLPARVDGDELRQAVEDLAEDVSDASAPQEEQFDAQLRATLDEAVKSVAKTLPRADVPGTAGQLCFNPCSFVRSCGQAIDVPAMGFAWCDPAKLSGDAEEDRADQRRPKAFWCRKPRRGPPPLAEENVLRNEFFEATIDPATGAIRAIHDYRTRGNRLAAQLAMRGAELATAARGIGSSEQDAATYSVMRADRIEAENIGHGEGRIISRGQLVDRRGERLCGFCQPLRAKRGSRVLELDVELSPERLPGPAPWQSYYALRFAWDDPAAELFRSVNLTSWPTEARRLEAPHFVEVRQQNRRTTILTGGLPYHRRPGPRKLDCLLVVHGETARRFRVGIGVDLPHPVAAAKDYLAPPAMHVSSAAPRRHSGWLVHVDTPSVIATAWDLLESAGRLAGFRARLLETEGHPTPVRLRSFLPPASARQTDFLGNTLHNLRMEGDDVCIELEAYQWAQVDVYWNPTP